MNLNIKQKFTAAVTHVKAHPVAYTFAATSALCLAGAAVADVYYKTSNLIDLDKAAAAIRETGMPLAFDHKDGVTTMLMQLVETSSLDRN